MASWSMDLNASSASRCLSPDTQNTARSTLRYAVPWTYSLRLLVSPASAPTLAAESSARSHADGHRSNAVPVQAAAIAAYAQAPSAWAPTRAGMKHVRADRRSSEMASLTRLATCPTRGCVHPGLSPHCSPAATATSSIRQAPSGGLKCAPTRYASRPGLELVARLTDATTLCTKEIAEKAISTDDTFEGFRGIEFCVNSCLRCGNRNRLGALRGSQAPGRAMRPSHVPRTRRGSLERGDAPAPVPTRNGRAGGRTPRGQPATRPERRCPGCRIQTATMPSGLM